MVTPERHIHIHKSIISVRHDVFHSHIYYNSKIQQKEDINKQEENSEGVTFSCQIHMIS